MKRIGPDEIRSIAIDLHNFLVKDLGLYLDEDEDFEDLMDALSEQILIEYMDPNLDYNYN